MYSVSGYGRMIADRVRTDAYARALRLAVNSESVVLDIGTGTGIFAMLACRFGARKVYAVEPSDAIEVARRLAADNGFADRIEFIQALSTDAALPERADVVISDLRGALPLFQHHIRSIADARRRLLAPGATLIPQKDVLWLSLAEAAELYRRHMTPADEAAYGFDMSAAREVVANTWRTAGGKLEQLLLPPRCWATLDYATIESPNVGAEVRWTAERGGTAHGVVAWFDAVLGEGVTLSNAPGGPELIYGQSFFPLLRPVELAAGDGVAVRLCADLVGEDYIWRWETRVLERGDPARVKAHFKQTTFRGVPLSPERLRRQSSAHVPELGEDGEADRFILSLMDGTRPLAEIAGQLSERFPEKFAAPGSALNRVGELSSRYSR